jgi:hypothetical protein
MSPLANIDNPLLAENSTVRYAFTSSELQAAATISGYWVEEMAIDDYYFEAYQGTAKLQNLTDNFVSKDFSNRHEMVIIREEIVERPFHLPGIFKLDYDPRQTLTEEGFSKVYDCGTVSAFFQNVKPSQR